MAALRQPLEQRLQCVGVGLEDRGHPGRHKEAGGDEVDEDAAASREPREGQTRLRAHSGIASGGPALQGAPRGEDAERSRQSKGSESSIPRPKHATRGVVTRRASKEAHWPVLPTLLTTPRSRLWEAPAPWTPRANSVVSCYAIFPDVRQNLCQEWPVRKQPFPTLTPTRINAICTKRAELIRGVPRRLGLPGGQKLRRRGWGPEGLVKRSHPLSPPVATL